MRSSHNLARVETAFDDDSVVLNAGLHAPAALAQKLRIAGLIDKRVRLPADAAGRANYGIKALTVVGAMLAGGDSIDDCDVLRAGAAPQVFTGIRAPSRFGYWMDARELRLIVRRVRPTPGSQVPSGSTLCQARLHGEH